MNGTSGEGMSLSVEERKQTAERWQNVSSELKITTMIQIGGASFADVIELVSHFGIMQNDRINDKTKYSRQFMLSLSKSILYYACRSCTLSPKQRRNLSNT